MAVKASVIGICEGIAGTWYYHLGDNATTALCGARVMTTQVPLSTWGMKSHLGERYCPACAQHPEGARAIARALPARPCCH
jgi:hypothetical protein